MILGVDVSHFQGTPDWRVAYNEGLRFVIAKSSQYIKDGSFDYNEREGSKAGLIVGAYHFGVPGYRTPEYQAGFMASIIANTSVKFAVLDIEQSNGYTIYQLRDWTYRFITELQKLVTIPVGIYSSMSYLANLYPAVDQTGCFMWPADISGTPSSYAGVDMHNWTFWQYSWSGRLPGTSGDVDLDYWSGTVETLFEFAHTPVDPKNPTNPIKENEVAGGIGSLCGYTKTKAVYLLAGGGKMKLDNANQVNLAIKLGAGNIVWTEDVNFLNKMFDIPSRVSIESDNAGRIQSLINNVTHLQAEVVALKGKR